MHTHTSERVGTRAPKTSAPQVQRLAPRDADAQLTLLSGWLRRAGWLCGTAALDPDAAAALDGQRFAGFLFSHPLLLATPARGGPLYVVDLQFADLFDIARPTAEYGAFHATLPRVFVGTERRFVQTIYLGAQKVCAERVWVGCWWRW